MTSTVSCTRLHVLAPIPGPCHSGTTALPSGCPAPAFLSRAGSSYRLPRICARAATPQLVAPSSSQTALGGSVKEEPKPKKKKGKKKGWELDQVVESKAAVVPEPEGGLGAGPKGGGEAEGTAEEVAAIVEELVTNTGFQEKTLEAVRVALADKPQRAEGFLQRVKGVTAAGNNREHKVLNAIAGWNEPITKAWRDNKCAVMAASPFAMYRGTAHLFWADFSGDWRMARFGSPKTRTWLLGDMHIYNMGAFLNSQEQVCYGLNDFDESVIGDYQYDLWRLAISLVLTARQNNLRKVDTGVQRDIVLQLADSYLSTVVAYERSEGGRTFTKDKTSGPLRDFLKILIKSKDTTREAMLQKLCIKDAEGRYVSFDYEGQAAKPPAKQKLTPSTAEERAAVVAAIKQHYIGSLMPAVREPVLKQGWPADIVLDVAHRINSGTGSLGMPRYYVLLDHRTNMHKGESNLPIVLDVKLQGGGPRGRPTPFYFMDRDEKAEYEAMFAHEGERHLRACRALTDATDPYLGYLALEGQGHFSVRERTPVKESYPALAEEAVKKFKDLLLDDKDTWLDMARSWGTILATLHAHAPHDFDNKMGRFHFRQEVDQLTRHFRSEFGDLLWQVAHGYALQVEQDYLYFKSSSLVPDDSKGQ